MKPHLSVITLGVDNLQKSLAFYRDGLGLPTKGITATEFKGDKKHPAGDVVMFKLKGGLILALYPRSELAKDSRRSVGAKSATEFSVGHIVQSKKQVDEILKKAAEAGGTITDKAHDRAWGIYSGYFQDPDGHLWEIIWNHQMPIA